MNLLILIFAASAHAQTSLTLDSYLEQVRTQNPEARSMREQVNKAQLRLDEAEVPLSSEFYTKYNYVDDKNEPTNGFMASRIRNTGLRMGVRDTTTFGLSTDFFAENNHGQMMGISPGFMMTDYHDSRAGVELKQSLWRNGFGEFTRANLEMQRGMSRVELLKRQFDYKNLMLRAENAYWTLVSLNQIVRVQEENLGRAKKLNDWMAKRVNSRLVDDVEGLQAQASLEMRDLELQTSLDERAQVARQFNTLRGAGKDEVEPLADLPGADILLKNSADPAKQMTREDFKIVYEQAEISLQQMRGARSQIAPQLDLTAGLATNGLDAQRSRSFEELERMNNPTWQVGVMFSIPLDYSLVHNMRKSYKAENAAAEALRQHAAFNEERSWHDLQTQKTEAQRRFQRSVTLEKTQTELVKRERERLLNGRTTTFQAITFEQNLAMAQIQRLRAQVGLLQIHNVLKTWESR